MVNNIFYMAETEKPILQFQEKPSNIPEIINFSCKSNKNKNVYISSSTVMSKYF